MKKNRVIHGCRGRFLLPLVLAIAAQWASARSPEAIPDSRFQGNLSGSYQVLQRSNRGAQAQIRMRIHLVNHGASELAIQRMTLWDFSHPAPGGSRACALTLRAHASADVVEEFTVARAEYQLWQRGTRPRLLLQIADPRMTAGGTAGGTERSRSAAVTNSTAIIRLERLSARTRQESGEEPK